MIENQQGRESRRTGLQTFKRRQILDAAKRLFVDQGLDGITMRGIAREAGYSVGAAYAYYKSKDDIFKDLLAETITELGRHIKMSAPATGNPTKIITRTFAAFHGYFLSHPEEQRLCLSLFYGTSPPSDEDLTGRVLDRKLLGILGYLANTLHQNSNLSASEAQTETVDAIAHIAGILLLGSSGRLGIMGQTPEEMIDRYMDQMLLRVTRQK